MIQDYIIQNWGLILISLAFLIVLKTTAFLDKTATRRMYLLIAEVLFLSVVVFFEFYLPEHNIVWEGRTVLMAIRYSATLFIVAQVLYTLVKKLRWLIFIPAIILAIICIISIFTGIVAWATEDGVVHRGPLGLLPFIVPALYGVNLFYVLLRRSNRQHTELIPIIFLGAAFAAGVILPFILGNIYSHIFCETIAIALFLYYVFSILNLTKKDPLTGLLNRLAFYADMETDPEEITGLISLDMNGLKTINDTYGHAAGDDALTTLALCFMKASKHRQFIYRIGGDEFVILCRKTSWYEVLQLIERIRKNAANTEYSCSIGYSCTVDGKKSVYEMMREADEMMYAEKAKYHQGITANLPNH